MSTLSQSSFRKGTLLAGCRPRHCHRDYRSSGSSCCTETLGLDTRRLVAQGKQIRSRRLDELCWTTDVGERVARSRPGDLLEQIGIDSAPIARPDWRGRAGQRIDHFWPGIVSRQALQFVAINDLFI